MKEEEEREIGRRKRRWGIIFSLYLFTMYVTYIGCSVSLHFRDNDAPKIVSLKLIEWSMNVLLCCWRWRELAM